MNFLPITTPRLTLRMIREEDAPFLVTLVQTKGWLRYIGERQITGPGEAEAYIRNLLNHPGRHYLVIEHQATAAALGILSFVQRKELPAPDFGFALLPQAEGEGYALEASHAFLAHLAQTGEYPILLAITAPDNERSISLLKKLDFSYKEEIEKEGKTLLLFQMRL
ncbi:Protein N-acetyltransferase, RimJ/RimL family [Muriicola jejuensis]|uniref:GNAT family N-acetyltransferase n=1 Tax=Muriicola jejuensis TaxID=504488 RepID=A0A6P0UBW5_9FLAO|nr:GNAT family N-acetyltransferase [Muriicola jejuensis]NER09990.1 GNAT family N-acetyltransferase [Muriicola jejuensis]SMP04026.1 Protein N-acetyltransferase, RimJ/RimL family [Muriicola jejuensis]